VAAVKKGSERTQVIPLVEVSAGGTLQWRSYEFCPGVQRCGLKQVSTLPGAARYVTDSPYVAPAVRLAIFPLNGLDSPLRGLGLGGSYTRAWLRTVVPVADGEVQRVSTTDEDFAVELLYRHALKLWGWEPFIGARAGILGRRFVLPENPLLTESRRSIGPVVGLELGAPLWAGLRLDASARYALAPTPGSVERAAYGPDRASSSGLVLSAGVSGQLEGSGWGWAATWEYALFQDTFAGVGERAAGGAAREELQGAMLFVRYRL
jgi:hypothetical protein